MVTGSTSLKDTENSEYKEGGHREQSLLPGPSRALEKATPLVGKAVAHWMVERCWAKGQKTLKGAERTPVRLLGSCQLGCQGN